MISPYKRPPKTRPVALVRADRTVLDSGGGVWKLRDIPPDANLAIFADREIVKSRFLTRGDGAAVCWNGTPIRWETREGHTVILLGSYPGDGDDVLNGLHRWNEFLSDHGAAIGSYNSSANSLLRATLERSIPTSAGRVPPITEVMGGRIGAFVNSGHYSAFESWDLSAAYAQTLGQLVYGGEWVVVDGEVTTTDAWPFPVIQRARVWTPRSATYGPLPRRLRKPAPDMLSRRFDDREYPLGRMVGVFTADELDAARAAGSTVHVERSWVHGVSRNHDQPFAPWWDAIREGRRLPGFAGVLAKRTGNALVGSFFGTPGDRTRCVWEPRNVKTHTPLPLPQKPAWMTPRDVAELVTSRVRARLLTELMLPAGDKLISVHTDGGLVLPGGVDRSTIPADWRCKDVGHGLVFCDPQRYAYRRRHQGSADVTVYKMSGAPPGHQAEIFELWARSWFNVVGVRSKRPHVSDADAWAALLETFDLVPV